MGNYLAHRWMKQKRSFETCCEDLPQYHHNKYEHPLDPEEVDDFSALTYFKGHDIYEAFDLFAFRTRNQFYSPRTGLVVENNVFFDRVPTLWACPFTDRFKKLFSYDGKYMSFPDFLDIMSAFSYRCPTFIKAEVAFRLYDFDEDGIISLEDVVELLKRLSDNALEQEDYIDAAIAILQEGDKDGDGYMNIVEFKQMIEKTLDFPYMFRHTIRLVRDLRTFM